MLEEFKMTDDYPRLSKAEYGSDVIVDLLKALDIEYVALNPGATFRELHESIVNYGGNQNPKIILCCHEEVAVDIAHGYNMAATKPMAAIVHNVVGLLNATMSIYNAWVDRTPVLILGATGPMATEKRRPWIDWIHTAVGQGSVVRDYVKWDDQVMSLPSAIDSILRGYQLTMTEPKGPVYVCLDVDLQREKLNKLVGIPDVSRHVPPTSIQGDTMALKKVAELLIEAERPVIIADYLSTKTGAVEALIELAELLSLPVLDNGNMFSFPNTRPLDLTGAKEDLLREADLVLSLDVFDLFQALTTLDPATHIAEYAIPKSAKIIDISMRHFAVKGWAQDYGKLQAVDYSITADTSSAIPALTSACRDIISQRQEITSRLQQRFTALKAKHDKLRADWRNEAEKEKDEKPVSLSRFVAELWDVVKDEDFVLINNANFRRANWIRCFWDLTKPYQYVGGNTGGGLGLGIGRALGVALAHQPLNRFCINIQPDGDLLFTPSGLWTAAHCHIPLLTVMFNNRSYYNSERHEELVAKARGRSTDNRIIGTRIEKPPVDFAKLAQSFGLYGEGPIEDPEDLHPALKRAVTYVREKKEPALVDVVTQSM